MKRLITQLALLIAVLCASIPAHAYDYDYIVDGIYYNVNKSNRTAEVTKGDEKYKGSINIPESITYEGSSYSVTSIGEYAFLGCDGLTSVTIPNSVTSIGEDAFCNCIGLTSVTIPNSVTSIGEYAFGNCSGLTSVTIGNSVTSIGDIAFYGCSGLTSVTIPNSVTSIGEYAFYGCSGLTSVTFNAEKCTEMGSSDHPLFKKCTKLSDLTIGEKVTTIPAYAFYGCSGLTSVTIPNSVTSIGEAAFYECSGLTSVTIGNSVTSIGDIAFYDCSGLTSLTIPASVTSIENYVFSNCLGLTSIVVDKGNVNYDSRDNCNAIIETATNTLITGCKNTIIPNSVTSIGEYAFFCCSGLTSVTIPNSVTSIGKSAFSYCSGLTSIVVDKGNVNYDSRNNCNAIIETATNTLITGCKKTIIPNSVTSIGEYAFLGCDGLTSVTIPNSVTSIGEDAFCNCIGLTSVTIPNSVTSIGGYAFFNCRGLTSVTIPNSVTSIGTYAFSFCRGLTSVTCLAPNPPVCGDYALTDIDKSKCTLYVLKESVNLYKIANQWKDFYNISEYDGVDDITVDADDAETLYDVYNIQGMKVGSGLRRAEMSDALPHGIYILVSPNATRKEKI